MARSASQATAGPMNTIIAGFIGLLVVVTIVILGPVLAGSMEGAIPSGICSYTNATDGMDYTGECGTTNTTSTYRYTTPYDATADWNPTYNSDIPSGSDIWTTNVVIGGIVILVFFIALAIYYIRVIA